MDRNDTAEGIRLYKELIEAATAEEVLRSSGDSIEAKRRHAAARLMWYQWVEQHSRQETDFVRSEARRLFPEVFTEHEESGH